MRTSAKCQAGIKRRLKFVCNITKTSVEDYCKRKQRKAGARSGDKKIAKVLPKFFKKNEIVKMELWKSSAFD